MLSCLLERAALPFPSSKKFILRELFRPLQWGMKREKEKFPRAAALSLVDELMEPKRLNLGASCVQWEVAGSIRRKKAFVGDIEIVLIPVQAPPPQLELGMSELPPDLESVMDEKIDALIRKGVLEKRKNINGHTMCGGRLKYVRHVASGIPIDFFICERATWATTFVTRTGSKELVEELAGRALRLGYSWNPGGVGFTRKSDGVKIPITTEEAAFRFVGLPCLPPEERV